MMQQWQCDMNKRNEAHRNIGVIFDPDRSCHRSPFKSMPRPCQDLLTDPYSICPRPGFWRVVAICFSRLSLRAGINRNNASILREIFHLRLPDFAREAPAWNKNDRRMTFDLTPTYIVNSNTVRGADIATRLRAGRETKQLDRQQKKRCKAKFSADHKGLPFPFRTTHSSNGACMMASQMFGG